MKLLEIFESRKGNKLIFRQNQSDIPALGSIVFSELNINGRENNKKTRKEIGKIIDVFGPVKTPWVVVNLKKDYDFDFANNTFFWEKFDRKSSKIFTKKKKLKKIPFKSKKWKRNK